MNLTESKMLEIWQQLERQTPPESMAIDRRTGEMLQIISKQQEQFHQIFTPQGLKAMFPGIN